MIIRPNALYVVTGRSMDLDTFSAMIVTFQIRSSSRALRVPFAMSDYVGSSVTFVWIPHELEIQLVPLAEGSREAADSIRNMLESQG